MVDAISLTFGGKERIFHFNNYALIELGKVLQCDPVQAHVELMNVTGGNLLTGMAALLYAGFIGYEKSQFILKPTITIQEIASTIGNMDNLDEFTPIWENFKKVNGITEFLEQQAAKQIGETEEKKSQVSGK